MKFGYFYVAFNARKCATSAFHIECGGNLLTAHAAPHAAPGIEVA